MFVGFDFSCFLEKGLPCSWNSELSTASATGVIWMIRRIRWIWVRWLAFKLFLKKLKKKKGALKGRKKQSLLHSDELAAAGGTGAAASGGLVPKWMGLVDEIHDDIGVIKQKMSELTQKHADHIQVRFGTANDEEKQIEVLTAQITKLYQQARIKVAILKLMLVCSQCVCFCCRWIE
jgi:hypothetical protein